MTDPRCTELDINVSTGGSVQIVKFNLRNDFGFSYTERYTIPESWAPERFEEWKAAKTLAIKAKIDEFAQIEQDALLESSDWHHD